MINKIRAYFHFLFDLANVNRNEWQVAIRKRGEQTLYQGNTAGFRPIKNSLRYWYADPFLFSHRDKDYLFVEMFDRWREKGVLGVCRLRNGKHSRFRICLDLPGHLSYPCVYEDADGIHMVPECYQSGEVWVYRCVDFPLRWEKERQLLKGCAVDTTPCPVQKGLWLTTVFDSPNARINNNLWQVDDRSGQLICLSKENFQVRGAGHFIPTEEGLIRPSQNCTGSYGENLVFNQGQLVDGFYREEPILKVYPPRTQCPPDARNVECIGLKKACSGIHTYNLNERYEVIDLRHSGARSIVTFLRNFISHLSQKRKNRRN